MINKANKKKMLGDYCCIFFWGDLRFSVMKR